MAQEHVCGLTGKRFATEEEYLSHVSEVTGHTPRDIEHHGAQGIRVAEKALNRTGSLKTKQKNDIEKRLDTVRSEDVDAKVREKRSEKTTIFKRLTK